MPFRYWRKQVQFQSVIESGECIARQSFLDDLAVVDNNSLTQQRHDPVPNLRDRDLRRILFSPESRPVSVTMRR